MPSRARWRRSPARRAGWCRGARRSPCRRGYTAARQRARRAPVRRGRRSGGRRASAARPLTVELAPVTARAPLESWQVGPWNRWAYVHVDEMVPTVAVGRGAAVRELPRGGEEVFEAPEHTDGLAVVRDGVLVAERYGGEMDDTSLHLSQSVGKSVLGLLVVVLGLDPATPVTDLVPEVGGSGYEGATLRHLLDMTAAIDFVEDYEGDFWRYDVACGWHPPREGAEAETVLDFLPTIGPAPWRHGDRMHYATPNTDLLGVAAERAGGPPDALGRGDASAFEQITTPEVRAGADRCGNQWWRRDGALMARGIHGQLIAADPDSRTVVVLLSSWPDAVDPQREAAQRAVVARARAQARARPWASPPPQEITA